MDALTTEEEEILTFDVSDEALEIAGSIDLEVAKVDYGGFEEKYNVEFSVPLTQLQTVSSVLSQMEEYGQKIGIDYACDVAYNDEGEFTATITLSYPQRGETNPSKTIDVNNALSFTYSEDGTEQCNKVWEASSSQETEGGSRKR